MRPGDRVRHLRAPKTTATGVVEYVSDDGGDPVADVTWSLDGLGVFATGTHLVRELEVVRMMPTREQIAEAAVRVQLGDALADLLAEFGLIIEPNCTDAFAVADAVLALFSQPTPESRGLPSVGMVVRAVKSPDVKVRGWLELVPGRSIHRVTAVDPLVGDVQVDGCDFWLIPSAFEVDSALTTVDYDAWRAAALTPEHTIEEQNVIQAAKVWASLRASHVGGTTYVAACQTLADAVASLAGVKIADEPEPARRTQCEGYTDAPAPVELLRNTAEVYAQLDRDPIVNPKTVAEAVVAAACRAALRDGEVNH